MKHTLLALLLVATAGLTTLCANETAQNISFDFTTSAGANIKIVETEKGFDFPTFKEKNVIIMFYIYPGKPCRNELQLFTKVKAKHTDLEFVTFDLKGLDNQGLKALENELGLKDLHMIDTKQAQPFSSYISQRIKWQGSVPLLIVVNKAGEVTHMQLGAMSEEETETMLKQL